jgi:hypothetical protein
MITVGRMDRLDAVIDEIESAKKQAIARFATEANMPVPDFLRHFRVICETPALGESSISFRVEPLDF